MNQILVSVLVPVYNVEKYLPACLDSILAQTLYQIEIICVNDGSTDSSLSILQEYEKKDSRIRVLSQENHGLGSARNAGINAAKGKYIGFVDSDDTIEPEMYEKMYLAAKKEQADLVMCGANIYPLIPEPDQWLINTLSPHDAVYHEYLPGLLFSKEETTNFIWRTLVRRDIIEQNHIRLDEDISLGEDKLFLTKVMPLSRNITVLSAKLYNYRWYREGSLMNTLAYHQVQKKLECHLRLIDRIANLVADRNIADEKKEFVQFAIPFIYGDFIYQTEGTKIKVASQIRDSMIKGGLYACKNDLPEWLLSDFEYMISFAGMASETPLLSLILYLDNQTDTEPYLTAVLPFLAHRNLECLVINNGAGDYDAIHRLVNQYPCVRLYNTPKKIAGIQGLNVALHLAAGKYIWFAGPRNSLPSIQAVDDWLSKAVEDDSDICIQVTAGTESTIGGPDLSQVLIAHDFVHSNELSFPLAGVLSVMQFVSQLLDNAKNISTYRQCIPTKKFFDSRWTSEMECMDTLDALNALNLSDPQERGIFLSALHQRRLIDYLYRALCNSELKSTDGILI